MRNDHSALAMLRAATSDIHRSLEERLLIASPDADKQTYVSYLSAFWGWLKPIESCLWEGEWPAALGAAGRAQKCIWMAQDLMDAGLDEEALAALPLLDMAPAFDDSAQRYGWAYVIEGSQLGNQVLRKALAPALAPWQPRWLQGYGEQTSRNWKTFIECAEDALCTDALREGAAQAACDAFASLKKWLLAHGAACSSMTDRQSAPAR